MINLKTIIKTIAIFAISGALLLSLTHSAFSTAPPRRGDEATWNSQLLTAYPQTWDPYVWNWNTGTGYRVAPDQYSWVTWTNGLVGMRCEDHGSFDGIWLATNFDQGAAQGLNTIDLATTRNLWLEASTSTIQGQTNTPLASWTGAKFDIWVAEKGTSRQIMMEMYIWRTGANTVWTDHLTLTTTPGSNVWNDRVALDWMMSEYGNGYEIESTASNGTHYYNTNVLGLLQKAVSDINNEQTPSPAFNINNFALKKVDFCLEAANNGAWPISIWVSANLYSLRLRYNTADINGDGTVNLPDLTFLSAHYGAQFGTTKYDFRADLDTNGVIGLSDLTWLSTNYGKTY